MSVLDVRDLRVTFGTESGPVVAVDGLSYGVDAGEILAIVGESGCGKSVGVLSLLGLQPDSARVSGEVRFQGEDLLAVPERRLRAVRGREVGYIFQDPMTALNPLLTVGTQITEVLRRHLRMSRAAATDRAVELLDLVGIPAARTRLAAYPHQLSGGMRQRVMIAIAIACGPRLLIADEPTTALDVTVQAGIIETLKDLRDRLGTAILIITHDMGVVADIADRVVVMYAGRRVEEAPVDTLFRRPTHPYTRGLLAAVPAPGQRASRHRLVGIPGTVPVLRSSPDACTFADRCPLASAQCEAARPEPAGVGAPGHVAACWHADLAPTQLTAGGAR
ncbi:ABC transporter ATP-binding protein [Cellulomonas dongxiuzhuiae]|uniref:ABC transporter ATP-binding protein n=1 Tax=Cellulomonas dongxiuzhuiae TaxID=2819979 RepID=A0ABX8GKX4_9CELL|nr:ABC transporter ATP-binding protein [Cellulomonas dongxiuzhuiae]MBO3089537.1 ABC transporter ATP-binding protein [Cellulomonas dongxiuzhuiae]MBO3095173.1 ABC transporter ATP-binding protein [Cellulomonas dongxiuzhuiae]QWC16176.1 ABC transporter ATP-binding protein [Cellulomonas dongxiuzhuiae]